ncbi:recF/RecN/SMC N terminal domain protein [Orientia chuto str. Dubai]|uniref:DNA replication and repair protein RecF n=1 Tax=Orientia chuto str. Dubai TaxID=1359168 RepID=A0A0F3MPQ0_9RICK|nr:DNA replication/repair protein RecF [Candidatus Orientia mediorientalis]KJV56564.1 recF/RecN/SMC N terminal domain protein [Orientia chuto str. Dubai]
MTLGTSSICRITKLVLHDYRNLTELTVSSQCDKILIAGINGSGKTNLLESISLFAPGRGLRGAKYDDILRRGPGSNDVACQWIAEITLQTAINIVKISTNYYRNTAKRYIKLNDNTIAGHKLLEFVNMICITPQMESVFLDGITQRRKLLDRIVFLFDHKHAERVNKYEHYLRERMILLRTNPSQTRWISVIENSLAKVSLEIALCRYQVIRQLQLYLDEIEAPFPKVKLDIKCQIMELYFQELPKILELISSRFYDSRTIDCNSGKSCFGVHRSDFKVTHIEKNQLAQFCSTGEQKALLISLLIAQMLQYSRNYGKFPILLLDELFIHLDIEKRQYLANFLAQFPVQCWISSTEPDDANLFNNGCITDLIILT